MPELFDKILKSEESLFLNPQFLDTDYQPKLVPFRENQQHHIANCIKPLLQRRTGKNVLIYGNSGVGKTACLKHVLNELKEDYSSEIYCLYINCWKKDTSFKIISEICEHVKYKWIHNKTFDDLMKSASEIINEKSVVIVLDEVDKLQDQNIIYSLLEDMQRKCLILITNEKNFLAKLDNRIKSRLIPDLLEFKPYNLEQTEAILKQRTEYAFIPDALQQEAFNIITKKTFEEGDIRTGLFLLKQAAEIAEDKSSRTISLYDVNKALETLAITDFNIDSLLFIIKENSGKTASEIFKVYEQKENKSYRTFQRKIKELEKENKIRIKEENKGFEGKQTLLEYV